MAGDGHGAAAKGVGEMDILGLVVRRGEDQFEGAEDFALPCDRKA